MSIFIFLAKNICDHIRYEQNFLEKEKLKQVTLYACKHVASMWQACDKHVASMWEACDKHVTSKYM